MFLNGSKGFPAEWRKDLYSVFGRGLLTGALRWPNKCFFSPSPPSPDNPQGHAKEVCHWQTRPEGSEWKLGSDAGPRSHDRRVQPSLWGRRTCGWDDARIRRLGEIFTPPPTLCLYLPSVLPHALMHPTRSLMRWLLSRVIHTWRPTCTRPPLVSCASNLKMTTERTRLIWTWGFRTFLKRRGKSPNTGYPAAALITRSSTTRRLVFFLWSRSYFVVVTYLKANEFLTEYRM